MPEFLAGPHSAPAPPTAHVEDDEERAGLLSASVASLGADETAVLPADLGLSGFDVIPEGEHVLSAATGKAKVKTP